jgi:protein-S-isoprenylcysteine O-methyltransferase Ste14
LTYIILGSFGFILLFIYDINSVIWKNRILHRLFFIGCMFLLLSTLGIMWRFRGPLTDSFMENPVWLGSALAFAGLLVHSLFFALPFEKTYIHDGAERKVHTEGVYALCRHPGVLWFIGLYASLYFMVKEPLMLAESLVLCFWNVIYIVFQDRWTFPRTFHDYGDYADAAPFLIPNKSSIRRFICAIRNK